MTVDKQTAKLIARIAENLPTGLNADVMQGWIDNPKGLQRFLRGLSPPSSQSHVWETPRFPVWKTIKLGTNLRTVDDFRKVMKGFGFRVFGGAHSMLDNSLFTVSKTEMEAELVNVSVAEILRGEGAFQRDFFKRAVNLGLLLCPAEVGPQLRLQYPDQPHNEMLLVGMEPMRNSDGVHVIFSIEHYDSALSLASRCGDPDSVCTSLSTERWVFLRRPLLKWVRK